MSCEIERMAAGVGGLGRARAAGGGATWPFASDRGRAAVVRFRWASIDTEDTRAAGGRLAYSGT